MKKIFSILVFLLFAQLLFAQQLSKAYILSEGGFSAGTSKLSLLEVQTNTFTQSIFSPGNLGLVPDGLIMYNKDVYVTEQGNYGGAGKIYRLDSTGMVINSSEVGTNPYSLTISNNKIYLSNGPVGTASVIKLDDFSFVKDIQVGAYPQEVASNNDYVFVANNSAWGGDSDSTVSVIDSHTDEIVSTITVKLNPSSLSLINDNYLLIGCPGDETSGVIYKVALDTFSKVDSFYIPTYGFGSSIAYDGTNEIIYFKGSTNDIIQLDFTTGLSERAVNTEAAAFVYGYNYDEVSETHFVLDAKDFASNGSVLVYNSEGELINTHETSIAPKRVAFSYSDAITGIKEDLIVNTFNLDQNYPNPFNPSTNISFQVQKEGLVNISIYNTLGEKVGELLNSIKQPGTYNVQFDGSNLTSGVYYYTMKTNNFMQTKKMLLTK